MNVQIEIIKTKVETKPSKQGSYEQMEVTYKNLTAGGKVEGKKLFSFGDNKAVFLAAKDWKEDQVINLRSEKLPGRDGKEYWTWVEVLETTPEPSEQQEGVKVTTKQQWVPDEVKQRLIVRQSCLAQAVNYENGTGNAATTDDVLKTAGLFMDWVYEKDVQEQVKKSVGRPKKVVEEQADEEVE